MYDNSNIKYTFYNSKNQKSLIDRFWNSNNINKNIKKINILDDSDNLSDHFPLILDIEIKLDKYFVSNIYREGPNKIKIWSIADKRKYQQTLHDLLLNLCWPRFFMLSSFWLWYWLLAQLITKVDSLIEITIFAVISIKH